MRKAGDMTLEDVEKILVRFGEGVPSRIRVIRVAYSASAGAYFVEWRDLAQQKAYDDAVADARDMASAESAYSVRGQSRFSVVFANEAPGGGFDYAVEDADPADDSQWGDVKDLRVVDAR